MKESGNEKSKRPLFGILELISFNFFKFHFTFQNDALSAQTFEIAKILQSIKIGKRTK